MTKTFIIHIWDIFISFVFLAKFSTLKFKIIKNMESHIKKPSTNSVGNWIPDEDEIILKYVYHKGKSNDNMMWGNL